MAVQYEIEVKSLLGSKKASDDLVQKMADKDAEFKQIGHYVQLNHYFKNGQLTQLIESTKKFYPAEKLDALAKIAAEATSISMRTRQTNDSTFLVVKGSLDETSAAHSHRRIEFEEPVGLPIEELDKVLLDAGFDYEAKWSADRKMYRYKNLTVDMFFTPGYGYLVEFEKVMSDESKIEMTRSEVLKTMASLGVDELPADRLERMFAYYNLHWPEYYGTKKVFTLE